MNSLRIRDAKGSWGLAFICVLAIASGVGVSLLVYASESAPLSCKIILPLIGTVEMMVAAMALRDVLRHSAWMVVLGETIQIYWIFRRRLFAYEDICRANISGEEAAGDNKATDAADNRKLRLSMQSGQIAIISITESERHAIVAILESRQMCISYVNEMYFYTDDVPKFSPIKTISGLEPDSIAEDERETIGFAIDAADTDKAKVFPTTIGRYKVRQVLGEGGFGRVYLADDPQLNRLVALKVPSNQVCDRSGNARDMLEEARRAARLTHHGIVAVYDVHVDANMAYIVQEYIHGSHLGHWYQSYKPNHETIARILVEIADAVGFAHTRGVIHRDLKPANVLVDEKGRIHVTDFGLAVHESIQRHRRGEICGTPHYMAPEQVRGDVHLMDGRVDIWSMGVILYELLTGKPPFCGETPEILFEQIETIDPRPLRQRCPEIPIELERICLKCLKKPMSERYAAAIDLKDELNKWISQQGRLIDLPKFDGTLAFYRYISQSKVKMLLSQFPAGSRLLAADGPQSHDDVENRRLIVQLKVLLRELEDEQMISQLPFDSNLSSSFYGSKEKWRNGLFYIDSIGDSTAVIYCAWKPHADSLIILVGSPSNLIGDAVARSGLTIATSGNAIECLWTLGMDRAYDTDGPFLDETCDRQHTFPIERLRPKHCFDFIDSPAIRTAAFCLDSLVDLPEMPIDTVFRIYTTMTTPAENLFEELEIASKQWKKSSDLSSALKRASEIGLDKYRTVHIGSPLYTALG